MIVFVLNNSNKLIATFAYSHIGIKTYVELYTDCFYFICVILYGKQYGYNKLDDRSYVLINRHLS